MSGTNSEINFLSKGHSTQQSKIPFIRNLKKPACTSKLRTCNVLYFKCMYFLQHWKSHDKSQIVCFLLVKINNDLTKTFPYLLTFFLKVKKSRKQFMISSIFPKNEREKKP